ncbi:hypothetical protein ABL78_5381 [Leptomonas seymouri]|uniref:CSC1/OSCA1-like 7TM region domain-containing protein n=1 Tax=Leptomonas seymouri TaxID=5684 RepID=A0A0N1HV91_LEPSE|nr:hypothetical protein ABL78_5381 [Leptomonas seymouri]|eukprot:KPI85552.1 hypothetical protein ABL78_5381 [Leptomonas seymouri]
MSSNTLSATSVYDDQGLYVSLIVGAALLVGLGGLMAFLHSTQILWLKRFYRPNHTIEPPPLAATAPAGTGEHRNSASRSPMTPAPPAGQSVFVEHTVRPHGRRGRAFIRRKRLGVSLPFTSTFFLLPCFQDWISIEEPSLFDRKESALSPAHYTTPAAPLRYTSDRPFMPIRTTDSPIAPSPPSDAAAPPTERLTADCNAGPTGAMESPPSSCAQRQQSSPPVPFPTAAFQPGESLPKTPTDPLVAIYLFTLKYFLALMFFGELFTMWIMVIASSDNHMERTMLLRDIHGCGRQDDNETGCNELKPYCKYRGVALGCAVVPLRGIYDLTVSNIKPRSWRWTPVGLLNLGFCAVLVLLTLVYLRKVGQYVEAVMANQMRHALGYRAVCIRGLDTTDICSENALRKSFLELSVYFPSESPSPSPLVSSSSNAVARQQRSRNAYVTNDSILGDYDPEYDSYTICECPGLNFLFSTAGVHCYVMRREDATFTEPGKVEQILITREPPIGLLNTMADTESAMAKLQEAIADEKALRRKLSVRNAGLHDGAADSGNRRHRYRGSSHRRAALPERSESAPLRATSVIVTASGVPSSNGSSGTAVGVRDHQQESEERAVLMMRCSFPACCDKIPAVQYYEYVFFKYAAELNEALAKVPHQPVAGAAFVIFSDSLSAFEFTQLFTVRFGGLTSPLSATIAGPPGRVFQSSVNASRCALYLRFFLIFWLYIVLIFTWSIPISFLGSLESLSQTPGAGRFLTYFASLSPMLQSLVNAYLPVLVLALFNVALPHIIRMLVRMMGAFNRSECDNGQLYLQYTFMVMTAVIVQAAFQGAMNRLMDLLFDPNEEAIVNFIVGCVTPSNGYFYAKIIFAACLSAWVDLLDPIGILQALLLRKRVHIQRNYDALFLPCEFEFPRLLSFDMMILSMGLLFHMTAPLLGLLTVGYFFVRYWSQRAKQTDRYRPTLSPAEDCTDFGVPAQVIRSVMFLYCFAETGGVLLMALRNHSGGVVLCSISLAIGITLTIYVHIKTHLWTASLEGARRFASGSSPSQNANPNLCPQQQQQPPPDAPLEMRVTSPLQDFTPPFGPSPVSTRDGGATAAAAAPPPPPNSALTSGCLFETSPEDNAQERQLGQRSRQNLVQEEGAMEGYEHVTLNQMLFDTTRNPFLSHLLPRKAGVIQRFQPKHQRLAPINAAAEVHTMHKTNFVVERYWDLGMTWFEEDTADLNWNGDGYVSESSGRDGDDDANIDASDRPNCPRSDSNVISAHGASGSIRHDYPRPPKLTREGSGSEVGVSAAYPHITAVVDAKPSTPATSPPEVVGPPEAASVYTPASGTTTPPPVSPSDTEQQRATGG